MAKARRAGCPSLQPFFSQFALDAKRHALRVLAVQRGGLILFCTTCGANSSTMLRILQGQCMGKTIMKGRTAAISRVQTGRHPRFGDRRRIFSQWTMGKFCSFFDGEEEDAIENSAGI